MTDPNLPPVTPPPPYPPPYPPPVYQQPAAPVYQQPAAPVYGQNNPYQQPYIGQSAPVKYNVMSIVSLVSGLLFFFSLIAIITGHIALSQIKKTGEKGRGLAIWGVILGYLGLVGIIIITVVAFLLPIWILGTSPTLYY